MLKLRGQIEIPVNFFKKLSGLYPAQVKYLQNLQRRTSSPTLKEQVGTLLSKPHLKDPIHSYNASIDYSKYLRKVKIPQPIKKQEIIANNKISLWATILNFIRRIFRK